MDFIDIQYRKFLWRIFRKLQFLTILIHIERLVYMHPMSIVPFLSILETSTKATDNST
jgi:hypothetical protein